MPPAIAIVLAMLVSASLVAATAAQESLLKPLDARAPLTYYIGAGDARSGYRAGDRELAAWALDAWGRSAGGRLRFSPANEASALIRVYWVAARDGQYGEMRPLDVGGQRGAAVYIRADTDALGQDIAAAARRDPLFRDAVVYLTCLHELGHALGLSHTADDADIMFFFGYGGDIPRFFGRYRDRIASRPDIARIAGTSAADVERLRALYPAGR